MALGYKTTTAFFSNINYLVNNTTKVADSTGKITDGVPKVLTGLGGGALLGKGAVDALEAYACNDGVCFVVSCIGVCADTLQIVGTWAVGPNVTWAITTPTSAACKTFVHYCKQVKGKMPWGSTC